MATTKKPRKKPDYIGRHVSFGVYVQVVPLLDEIVEKGKELRPGYSITEALNDAIIAFHKKVMSK